MLDRSENSKMKEINKKKKCEINQASYMRVVQ